MCLFTWSTQIKEIFSADTNVSQRNYVVYTFFKKTINKVSKTEEVMKCFDDGCDNLKHLKEPSGPSVLIPFIPKNTSVHAGKEMRKKKFCNSRP